MGVRTKDFHEYYDEDNKDDQIWEWVSGSCMGMLAFTFGEVPEECINFCIEQYARFGLPFDMEILDVIRCGASAALYYADVIHPYALFRGLSDVDATQDWATHTYLVHGDGTVPVMSEAEPIGLETFAYVPGQAEAEFMNMLSRPGLEALPYGIGDEILEVLEGRGEEAWDGIDDSTDFELRRLCTPPGADEPDAQRMKIYFEMAAWAGFIWLCGPLGRDYRFRHTIIEVAMQYGEAILLDGTIIAPCYYTKQDRPPNSCYRCGNQVWCVEHTMVGAQTATICEHCLNGYMQPMNGANCGTKFCRETRCPTHPLNHLGQQGMYSVLHGQGQLTTMTRDGADLRLHGLPGSTLQLVDRHS